MTQELENSIQLLLYYPMDNIHRREKETFQERTNIQCFESYDASDE